MSAPTVTTVLPTGRRSSRARPLDVRRPRGALAGVPSLDGDAVEVLGNGTEVVPAVLSAARGATRSVDIVRFPWGSGARPLRGLASDGLSGRRR